MSKRYRSDADCLNCGASLHGKFCSHCGQENLDLKESFWHMLVHSVSHYFHFDNKFFNSLVPLFTQPGKLTIEYNSGRRASHLHPVSMYLFISILFFLVFLGTQKSDSRIFMASPTAEKVIEQQGTDKKQGQRAFIFGDFQKQFKSVAEYDAAVAKLPEKDQPSFLTKFLERKSISMHQKYGQQAETIVKNVFINNVPKIMFILMPLFAVILMLAFYKSRMYFIEHFIYTLHVHCFLFLYFLLLYGLSFLIPNWITLLAAIAGSTWYIFRSLRVVYNRSFYHTLFKFSLLSLCYFFVFVGSILLILGYALATA